MFFGLNNPLACLLNIIPQWLVILGTVDRLRARPRSGLVTCAACRLDRLRKRAQFEIWRLNG